MGKKCRGIDITVNGAHIFTLQFADDEVLIAQDKDELEYMTKKIKKEYKHWGLSINIDKRYEPIYDDDDDDEMYLKLGDFIEIRRLFVIDGTKIS